jgi:hypothetical protein
VLPVDFNIFCLIQFLIQSVPRNLLPTYYHMMAAVAVCCCVRFHVKWDTLIMTCFSGCARVVYFVNPSSTHTKSWSKSELTLRQKDNKNIHLAVFAVIMKIKMRYKQKIIKVVHIF